MTGPRSACAAAMIVGLLIGLVSLPAVPARAEETEATVEMLALRFMPGRLEIRTGTTVTWSNEEPLNYPLVGGGHRPEADDGSWRAPLLVPGAMWSRRFLEPGSFSYRCAIHDMAAELIVTGEPIRPQQVEVSIEEDEPGDPDTWGYVPGTITIDAGMRVLWRNNGSTIHTVTATDGSFTSGDVDAGEVWQKRFSAPGIYRYYCDPHPWMTAVVRVAGADGVVPTAPEPPPERRGDARSIGAPEPAESRRGEGPVTHRVAILEPALVTDWTFDPPDLRIRAGDAVRWTNRGVVAHTVTAADGSFDFELSAGDVVEHVFARAGSVSYICRPHPWMTGTVTVVKSAAIREEPEPTVVAQAAFSSRAFAVDPPIGVVLMAPVVSPPRVDPALRVGAWAGSVVFLVGFALAFGFSARGTPRRRVSSGDHQRHRLALPGIARRIPRRRDDLIDTRR